MNKVVEFISKHPICSVIFKSGVPEFHIGGHEELLCQNDGYPMICIGRMNFANEAWYCTSIAWQHYVAKIAAQAGIEINIIQDF
jgi:hypothetical protein